MMTEEERAAVVEYYGELVKRASTQSLVKNLAVLETTIDPDTETHLREMKKKILRELDKRGQGGNPE